MDPAFIPVSTEAVIPIPAVDTIDHAVDPSIASVPAIRASVDARGLALGILAVLASIYSLSWAQGFVVPLLLGIIIAYTLNPIVTWLEAIRIPRMFGTAIVMASLIGALLLGVYSLRGQVQTIIEQLPVVATKFATGLARMRLSQGDTMQRMQTAAAAVEKATTQAPVGTVAARQPATHVVVDQPTFKIGDFVLGGSMSALAEVGQASMVIFLVFFLLIGGDRFKRKLVRMTGPTLSNKKITVQILDDINGSIQKYMLMLCLAPILGLAMGRVGTSAQYSHHRHRPRRIAAREATAGAG